MLCEFAILGRLYHVLQSNKKLATQKIIHQYQSKEYAPLTITQHTFTLYASNLNCQLKHKFSLLPQCFAAIYK